jgi:hypothetical protein
MLDSVDLRSAVITADAAHARRETAEYIAGARESDYFLFVKGNQPSLQKAAFDAIQEQGSTSPASPRSPAPSRPSHATGTASSTTCRHKTRISNSPAVPHPG